MSGDNDVVPPALLSWLQFQRDIDNIIWLDLDDLEYVGIEGRINLKELSEILLKYRT